MSQVLSRMYSVLLDLPTPSLEIQRSVLAYAVRTKETSLVAKLARHDALEFEIDLALRDNDAAVVKAAWAARPGRTAEELVDLVRNEKRVTILSALAERDDLPADVYTAIAGTAKGVTPLLRVVGNTVAPDEARFVAASRYIEMAPEVIEDIRLDHKVITFYGKLFEEGPDLVDRVVRGSAAMHLLYAAAGITQLDAADQVVFAKALVAKYDKYEHVTQPSNSYNSYGSQIAGIAESMCDNGALDGTAADLFTEVIGRYIKTEKADSWTVRRAEETLKSIVRARNEQPDDIADRLVEAKTAEEIEVLIKRIDALHKGSRSYAQTRVVTLGLSVIANPASTVDQVVHTLEWLSWRATAQSLRLTNDVEKLAAIMSESPYWTAEQALEKATEPQAIIEAIIRRNTALGRIIPTMVLTSRHLTPEAIDMLPLGVVNCEGVPPHVVQQLFSRINNGLDSAEAWVTFEAISDDFVGTLDDLVTVSSSV